MPVDHFPISVMMFIFLCDGSEESASWRSWWKYYFLNFFNVLNYCLLPYLWSSLQCLLVVSPINIDIHISCLIVLKGDLKKKNKKKKVLTKVPYSSFKSHTAAVLEEMSGELLAGSESCTSDVENDVSGYSSRYLDGLSWLLMYVFLKASCYIFIINLNYILYTHEKVHMSTFIISGHWSMKIFFLKAFDMVSFIG